MSIKFLKKLSTATIIGKIPAMQEGEPTRDLYTIMGIATKMKHGEGDFGEWTCFIGQFEAIKIETGEIFRSSRCFLPRMESDEVSGALASGAEQVQFAFKVSVQPSDKGKYEYICQPLSRPAESDALSNLRKVVGEAKGIPEKAVKALSAASETKKENPKKETAKKNQK